MVSLICEILKKKKRRTKKVTLTGTKHRKAVWLPGAGKGQKEFSKKGTNFQV